jgi:hypothetical protein
MPASGHLSRPVATVLVVAYLLLAVVGLVGTWYFNLQFGSSGAQQSYLAAWFANPASSSAAVDIIVTAVAACVFFAAEGRRLGMNRVWVLIPLTFVLALAFTFPLFLAWRERTLLRRSRSAPAAANDAVPHPRS